MDKVASKQEIDNAWSMDDLADCIEMMAIKSAIENTPIK